MNFKELTDKQRLILLELAQAGDIGLEMQHYKEDDCTEVCILIELGAVTIDELHIIRAVKDFTFS